MHARVIGGAFCAYGYNEIIAHIPCHWLRILYLRCYLGGIGKDTSVQMHCRFLNGRKVQFGERNVINFGCLFDGRSYKIRIGNDVSIGPEATILTLGHDPQSGAFSDCGGDVTIGNNVWIAYRSIVLPGVKIGDGAVIGAGALATKNVEPFAIMAGVPAKKIGERNRQLDYQLQLKSFLL